MGLEFYCQNTIVFKPHLMQETDTLSTLLNRIYLSNLSSLINRQDRRSIRKWCEKSNLNVYKDFSGEFVYEAEFEFIYNKPLIENLKKKYGENWLEYYNTYTKGELHLMIDTKEKKMAPKYKPKGKISQKFCAGL